MALAAQGIDKDDARLLIWLLLQVQSAVFNLTSSLPDRVSLTLYREQRRDEIILALDSWQVVLDSKQQFLNNKKAEWGQIRTHDRETKWLDPKDTDQLTWAWEYLCKKFKTYPIPNPVTAKEYHAAVLAALDNMSYGHPAEKSLFLDKMKTTWGQKKYRDSGKAKKLYNLPLTKTAREQLEWLAKHSEAKTTDILERLISEGYEKANINPDTQTKSSN